MAYISETTRPSKFVINIPFVLVRFGGVCVFLCVHFHRVCFLCLPPFLAYGPLLFQLTSQIASQLGGEA